MINKEVFSITISKLLMYAVVWFKKMLELSKIV